MSLERPSLALERLGLRLPPVAAPVAAYVPAMRVHISRGLPGIEGYDEAWTSGQLPFVDGVLAATGSVGTGSHDVPPDVAKDLARTCALNALAAAADLAGGIDNIRRVLKIVGYVSSAPGFYAQPAVIDGASELFGQVFGPAGAHARSAVGVSALPLNSPVEVEAIFEITLR